MTGFRIIQFQFGFTENLLRFYRECSICVVLYHRKGQWPSSQIIILSQWLVHLSEEVIHQIRYEETHVQQ